MDRFREPPLWANEKETSNPGFVRTMHQLHAEITEFYELVSPTPHDHCMRTSAVQRFEHMAKSLWPSCELKVFGSFATGLYLPSSDIDVIIILNSGPADNVRTPLWFLADRLRSSSFGRNVDVRARAKFPIVKFEECRSGLIFDVRFDVSKELQAVEMIKHSVADYPSIAPLYMALKAFMQEKKLNEVYRTGGIASYTLFVMLKAFLMIYKSSDWGVLLHSNLGVLFDTAAMAESAPKELGFLLVSFFHFYGVSLNARQYGVSCQEGALLFKKMQRGFHDHWKPDLLAVEDPLTPTNDIGRNSFNFSHIQGVFVEAYKTLKCSQSLSSSAGLLSCILPLAGTQKHS